MILEGMLVLVKLFSSESDLNFFSFKDNSISFGNTLIYLRKIMYPFDPVIVNISFIISINPIAIMSLIIFKNKNKGIVVKFFKHFAVDTFFFSHIYITIFVIDYRKCSSFYSLSHDNLTE